MSPPLTQSAAGDKVLRIRVDTGDDIEDPSHYMYSIEDAKQKAEHDRKLEAAEANKNRKLVLQNKSLISHTHTHTEEWRDIERDAHKDKERRREDEGGKG